MLLGSLYSCVYLHDIKHGCTPSTIISYNGTKAKVPVGLLGRVGRARYYDISDSISRSKLFFPLFFLFLEEKVFLPYFSFF